MTIKQKNTFELLSEYQPKQLTKEQEEILQNIQLSNQNKTIQRKEIKIKHPELSQNDWNYMNETIQRKVSHINKKYHKSIHVDLQQLSQITQSDIQVNESISEEIIINNKQITSNENIQNTNTSTNQRRKHHHRHHHNHNTTQNEQREIRRREVRTRRHHQTETIIHQEPQIQHVQVRQQRRTHRLTRHRLNALIGFLIYLLIVFCVCVVTIGIIIIIII